MNIPTLYKLLNLRTIRPGKHPVAFAHWDRDNLYYFIGSLSQTITTSSTGVLPLANPEKPFSTLAAFLKESHGSVNQVVALISRPELDLSTLTLPKGTRKKPLPWSPVR